MTSNENGWVRRDSDEGNYVSGRFLTDFLGALERQGISGSQLIGDLPIPITDTGVSPTRVAVSQVEWPDFVEFMKRLERAIGGAAELEACGSAIDEMKPAAALRGLAGLTASPLSLYRAAIRWALRRAIPGIETTITVIDENHIEIHARLKEGMRGCSQIFHFAVGGTRALPRILGLQDALVDAEIGPNEALYRVTLPPSPTIFARTKRFVRTLVSAGDVLRTLETQQLELHAEHDALQKAHAALAENQERYRAFTDATVDVLCELDSAGQIAFVSASVHELLGYTRDQVTGSHFRLWVPTQYHQSAVAGFKAVLARPSGGQTARHVVALHAASGDKVVTELSLRSFKNSEGEWRMACVLRELTRVASGAESNGELATPALSSTHEADANLPNDASIDRLRGALAEQSQDRDAASDPQPAPPNAHVGGAEGVDAACLRENTATASSTPPGDRSSTQHPSEALGHPLELSLERLLSALESHAKMKGIGTKSTDLIRASDAMTRIVDSALVAADADFESMQWVETLKIIERVRQELDSSSERSEIEIHYRLDSMPAQVCVREDLLVVGLSHLIDNARQTAPASSQLEFSVLLGRDSGGYACVEFLVETQVQADASRSVEAIPNDGLSIAIATDAAKAHDGELLHERNEGAGETSRLRVPSLL